MCVIIRPCYRNGPVAYGWEAILLSKSGVMLARLWDRYGALDYAIAYHWGIPVSEDSRTPGDGLPLPQENLS